MDNVLIGNDGINVLAGGDGNDSYTVSSDDIVVEQDGEGIDGVYTRENRILDSHVENLTLLGWSAVDGSGNELHNILVGNNNKNRLDGGIGADTMIGGDGDDIYIVDDVDDIVEEGSAQGIDLVESAVSYALSPNIENLSLIGESDSAGTGNNLNNVIKGNGSNNTLHGGEGDDQLDGGLGDDLMFGGAGDDVYAVDASGDLIVENVDEGFDLVQSTVSFTLGNHVENLILAGSEAIDGTGNALANFMRGNKSVNTIGGGADNDLLEGGAGNDTIDGESGNGYLNGGVGSDSLIGGNGIELILGGKGSDKIAMGSGADIILFNEGDGSDRISASTDADNTISLGGGISYEELFFEKSDNNLILRTNGEASSEGITFTNWYKGTGKRSAGTLQVIAQAMSGFSQGGADPLLDQKVERFDFLGLVNAFDAARAADVNLTSWALTSALTSAMLGGADDAAIGGDLAYQYGRYGNLANVGTTGAQNVLGNAAFGTQAQTFQTPSNLQQGIALS